MSAYTDAAPLLSTAVGVTVFKSDNPAPVAVEPVPEVPPTKAQVTATYTALKALEASGIGYSGVARQTGVSKRLVKQIHAEMAAAKAAVYTPVVVEAIPK